MADTSIYDQEASTLEGRLGLLAAETAMRVYDLLLWAKQISGVSNRELARRLGITEGRVSQVLNGDGNVHIATLVRFLGAYGYRLDLAIGLSPELKKLAQSDGESRRTGDGEG